jgi:hypothetical protein
LKQEQAEQRNDRNEAAEGVGVEIARANKPGWRIR